MAVDTSTTISADCSFFNDGNDNGTTLYVQGQAGNDYRGLTRFTMPNLSGTVTDVKLYYYNYTDRGAGTIECHQATGTGGTSWVESQAKWTQYSTGNNWTSSGGDFSATVIHSLATSSVGWYAFILMGTGSTNPLTLTWNDTVNLLFKMSSEGGSLHGVAFRSNSAASELPYVEVTYTSSTFEGEALQKSIIVPSAAFGWSDYRVQPY